MTTHLILTMALELDKITVLTLQLGDSDQDRQSNVLKVTELESRSKTRQGPRAHVVNHYSMKPQSLT